MTPYSRLARKVVRTYLKSKFFTKLEPKKEYKLLRRSFRSCRYCYLMNLEKYGKRRHKRIQKLKAKYKSKSKP